MEKKIVTLNLAEVEAVVGGVSATASLNATAAAAHKQQASQPVPPPRHEQYMAR